MSTVWPDVLKCLLAYLDPEDAFRLSAGSKQFQLFLEEQLSAGRRILARAWLPAAVQQAAVNTPGKLSADEASCFDKSCGVVRLLLATSAIPAALLAEDSSQYLSIPNVPLDICRMLVAAGVCVSYQHLVEAACQHTEGLHHWVKACELQGVSTDLTPDSRALCCGLREASAVPTITADNLAGHFHLAINALSSNSSTAQAAAAARNLYSLLDWSLTWGLRQQLTAAAVLQLLHSLVHVLATRRPPASSVHDISHVCFFRDMLGQVSDPEHVTPEAVANLVQAALNKRLEYQHIYYLLSMPAVQQLSADAVAALLRTEFQSADALGCVPDAAMLIRLLELPPAQDLDPNACVEVFDALLEAGKCTLHMVRAYPWTPPTFLHKIVVYLPGMQLLSASQLVQLLQHAIEVHRMKELHLPEAGSYSESLVAGVVGLLCCLPAAAHISAADLQQLVQRATALWPDDADLVAHLQQVSLGVHAGL